MKRRRIGVIVFSIVMLVCGAAFFWMNYAAVEQERRNTALIAAIKRYDTRSVVELLKNGADPNTRDGAYDASLWDILYSRLTGTPLYPTTGPTALQVVFDTATIRSKPNQPQVIQTFTVRPEPVGIVEALLAKGARVNVNYSNLQGWPLIIYPASYGWADSVRMMLEKGAVCNARAANGATLLTYAVNSRNSRMVKLLLERGAIVNTRDSQGKTALTDAATFSTPEIIALLKKAGGKR